LPGYKSCGIHIHQLCFAELLHVKNNRKIVVVLPKQVRQKKEKTNIWKILPDILVI
jgi:hypothetical protein